MNDLINCEISRCLTCPKPFCQQGCPLHNDMSAVVKYLRLGELDKAVDVIGHPFGEICGYACSHESQCEGRCLLNKRSYPVLTATIERELFAMHPYVVNRKGSALQGRCYAVVGGGIAGLTFATKVYEQGADVTVFERDELLSTIKLIPGFRMPAEAVLRAQQSVAGKFNVVREQIDGKRLKELQSQFNGVYVATGLTIDYALGVEGQEFAVNYRDCLKGNYSRGTVIIVGGGNSAMDCARLARRQGCKAIVAYRRTEQDMPAFCNEVSEAYSDGVEFMFNVAPTKLYKDGEKLRLTLAKTVNEGRGKLVVTDETFEVACDSVIAAIGSKFDGAILSCGKNDEQYLQYENVYLGGDARRGKLVVDAVADGLAAANQIIDNARKICL